MMNRYDAKRRREALLPAAQAVVRCSARFCRDTGGAAVVIAAILFPVVIGGMGLGAETGYWYLTQRKIQHAADTAAHAAGVRKRAGDADSAMYAAALYVADETGFSPSSGMLTINVPPVSGPHAGDGSSIEVLVEETRPRLFSAVFSSEPVKIHARAVAKISGGSTACVLALSRDKAGAVTVSGSTSVELANCIVASNSNAADAFLMSGTSPALSADCVITVGEAVTTVGLTLTQCPAVRQNGSAAADPYAGVPEPVVWGSCSSNKVGSSGKATTITPLESHPSGVKSMRFCGGLDVKGSVTFEPGLYIIDGGTFTVNGGDAGSTSEASVLGEGVTFLFANGAAAKLTGSVSMSLAAPVSGPYAGILFFGSRQDSGVSHQIAGTTNSVLQGALYAPVSELTYRGNSATTDGCTQIVADKIVFSGNSTMRSACEKVGAGGIMAGQLVTIVE